MTDVTVKTLLCDRLKSIRKRSGMTQEKFAKAIGVKRCTIGAYEERRAAPNLEVIRSVCKLFDLPVNAFYDVSYEEKNIKHEGKVLIAIDKQFEETVRQFILFISKPQTNDKDIKRKRRNSVK